MKFINRSLLKNSRSSKIIVRIDDVCETMDWDRFFYFKKSLEELQIRAILGVVPDCKDQSLMVNEARTDFYDLVRKWRDYGDTIAQHGFDHIYVSTDPGLMAINKFSEFAGLCYEDQLKKLAAGKEIMVNEDIWEPHFMAPAHSFDDVTIQCLSELGFQTITDGYGFYPYEYKGMLLVPQLFSRPIPLPTGIQTIALHLNHGSRQEIDYLLNFLKLNKDRVVPYSSVVKCNPSNDWMAKFFRFLTRATIRTYRQIRR